ncbi:Fc.00g016390.m01.CDS01 [Cosmosporella sp. VM-42]
MSFFASSSIPTASTSITSSSPTELGNLQSASDRIGDEVEIIRNWFSVLGDAERTEAFNSITELALLREIEPLIQTLKDRKRELWRQQEDLLIQQGYKEKWPVPSFPRDSRDPRWLPKWLRALRLHKYEKCLDGMSPAGVSRLKDEDLQELGVDTVGARTKLLRAIKTE